MYQTRNAMGEIREWPTLKAAREATQKDPSIWKLSFNGPDGARIRLVREVRWVGETNQAPWVFEPIDDMLDAVRVFVDKKK